MSAEFGRQIEGLAVGDVHGLEAIDLAEPPDRLVTPLEESGIEIARDHTTEFPRERTCHPTDAAPDLDERPLVEIRRSQAEHREIGADLGITGGHELLQREVGTLLVVEHPARRAHDVVTARLLLGDEAGRLPRNELRSLPHQDRLCQSGPADAHCVTNSAGQSNESTLGFSHACRSGRSNRSSRQRHAPPARGTGLSRHGDAVLRVRPVRGHHTALEGHRHRRRGCRPRRSERPRHRAVLRRRDRLTGVRRRSSPQPARS